MCSLLNWVGGRCVERANMLLDGCISGMAQLKICFAQTSFVCLFWVLMFSFYFFFFWYKGMIPNLSVVYGILFTVSS